MRINIFKRKKKDSVNHCQPCGTIKVGTHLSHAEYEALILREHNNLKNRF